MTCSSPLTVPNTISALPSGSFRMGKPVSFDRAFTEKRKTPRVIKRRLFIIEDKLLGSPFFNE
jgi:hypothetical protein